MAADVCEIVLMGFGVTENVYQKTEYSYGFEEETIRELMYYKDPNFKFRGFVNTGAYNCVREGTEEPLSRLPGHIRFQSSIYEKFNRYERLAKTRRIRGSIGELVYPTVALIFDDSSDNLIGMIHFPDQYWSNFKGEFFRNLNFFLHPFDDRYPQLSGAFKNGCQLPGGSRIIMIDSHNLEQRCAFELAQREKNQAPATSIQEKPKPSFFDRFRKTA